MNKGFWSGRKVLVTGAGGFIGSHLCEVLAEMGAQVTAMIHYDIRADRSNLEFLPEHSFSSIRVLSGDVCDPFFMREAVSGQDTVFHLAALIAIPYSYVAPQMYFRVNVEGTLNVAEACRSAGVRRLVHTSTSETYGTALYTPIDEKHPIRGQSPYSASKIGADKLIESYHLSFGLPAVTLRPFNTYGPRQSARAVLPTIITQLLSDSEEIHLGDLTPVRDMNYVRDTVDAFLLAAEHDACIGKTLNAGSGRAHSIGDFVQILMNITGKQKRIVQDPNRLRPAASEVYQLLADSTALNACTGWRPQWTVERGLAETVEFVRNNISRFEVGKYAL